MRRLLAASVLLLAATAQAATFDVGPGKAITRLEDALKQAKPGDEIVVHAADAKAYTKTALLVRTQKLTIRAADKNQKVVLDGAGFDYSGRGSVPRAIVQFDPAASDCVLEGFELINARNSSNNGAGVRINQANNITIRNCMIRNNDMGIMSNGKATDKTAVNQLIEYCTVTKNGTEKHAGYNHNFYLGGTSVFVRGCEISDSVTGHNVKSRAHFNWFEYNRVSNSANREFDLVDGAGATDQPDSHSVLLGNIITKKPKMTGNKSVIHFGKDVGTAHTGTLFLLHNTITTPYVSPVVDLSSDGASAVFINNKVEDAGAKQAGVMARVVEGAKILAGEGNVVAEAFVKSRPAAVGVGLLVPWAKVEAPWERSLAGKQTPLLMFESLGNLAERKAPAAGAK